MPYECKILLDSTTATEHNKPWVRLTTFEITFPRIVLAEFNTHRVFGRNSASSRAIPVEKMIQKVLDDPFVPFFWGKKQSGMAAEREISLEEQESAKRQWLKGRDSAVEQAKSLLALGLHKQIANRVLETYMYHTVIVTATEFENFFKLRTHPTAQPEIRKIAEMMLEAYNESTPNYLEQEQWHVPMLTDEERLSDWLTTESALKIATGRLARVSYMTHTGVRDVSEDIKLHDSLAANGHFSPFEHCAQVRDDLKIGSHLRYPFVPYRKFLNGESGRLEDANKNPTLDVSRGWISGDRE